MPCLFYNQRGRHCSAAIAPWRVLLIIFVHPHEEFSPAFLAPAHRRDDAKAFDVLYQLVLQASLPSRRHRKVWILGEHKRYVGRYCWKKLVATNKSVGCHTWSSDSYVQQMRILPPHDGRILPRDGGICDKLYHLHKMS